MKLLFLYGPPAVGKLTVAEELVKLNNHVLFHNHLTQDLAKELYPEFNELRFKLVDRIRLDIFEYAAENDTDLVFTYVYDGGSYDTKFVGDVVKTIRKHGGTVQFVQLQAPKEALLDRVDNDSRKQFHKLKDREKLRGFLESHPANPRVPFDNVLVIDTDKMSAHDAAVRINECIR